MVLHSDYSILCRLKSFDLTQHNDLFEAIVFLYQIPQMEYLHQDCSPDDWLIYMEEDESCLLQWLHFDETVSLLGLLSCSRSLSLSLSSSSNSVTERSYTPDNGLNNESSMHSFQHMHSTAHGDTFNQVNSMLGKLISTGRRRKRDSGSPKTNTIIVDVSWLRD